MSLSVFLIDDDETTQYIFKMVLEYNQGSLISMSDGESALAYLKDNQPSLDVIVMDIYLPGKNGYEMLSQIRQLRPGTKVVATTAYHMEGTADQLLAYGFDGVL